jgi:hypothetical protein
MYQQSKEDCLEKGLLVPDIATVKEDCFGKGVPAPGIETVKASKTSFVSTSLSAKESSTNDLPSI